MGNQQSTQGTWNCPNPNRRRRGEAKIPLHFLIIGRSGGGKSATGNSILGKKAFEHSKTKNVDVGFAQHGRYDITVVDSPGLKDTDLSKIDDVERAVKNMVKALLLCNGSVNVFVLVLKLGDRFTPEMKETISDFKAIFGEDYWRERGIIVVTGGDDFDDMMKNDGTPGITFMEWVGSSKQNGEFKKLVRECGSRAVLFNNYATDKEEIKDQRNWLFRHAEKLGQRGCYTSDHLKMYRDIRQKLTQDINLLLLKEDFQRKVNSFIEELACFNEEPSIEDVDRLDKRIEDLLSDVTNEDSEEQLQPLKDVFLELGKTAANLKNYIMKNDAKHIKLTVTELQSLKQGMKKISKIPWKKILIYFLKAVGLVAVTASAIALLVTSSGALLPVLKEALPQLVSTALLAIGSTYLEKKIKKN